MRRLLLFLSMTLFSSAVIGSPAQSAKALDSITAGKNAPIFAFQDNFWVNLNHFLRAESRRRTGGVTLELSVAALKAGERSEWESALTTYTDLAKRSFIFDETLTQIDNVLAKQSEPIKGTIAIDPKFVTALNRASPIYRQPLEQRPSRQPTMDRDPRPFHRKTRSGHHGSYRKRLWNHAAEGPDTRGCCARHWS